MRYGGLCLAMLLSTAAAWAENTTQCVVGVMAEPVWTINRVGPAVHFTVMVPGYQMNLKDGYGVLEVAGQCYRSAEDPPLLPRLAKVIRLDGGGAVSTDWSVVSSDIASNILLQGLAEVAPNGDRPAWQPDPPVIVDTAWMGTQCLLRIECCPLQYDSAGKQLKFNKTMKGVVTRP